MDTYQYVQLYANAFAPLRNQFNFSSIAELYAATDFIGISSYPSLKPNFTTPQLEAATEQFDFEIGQFGVNLKDLVNNKVFSFCLTSRLPLATVLFLGTYPVSSGDASKKWPVNGLESEH